ncbi:MAG: TonB-dependent receptor [Prevotella sp.]|uniref:TonB-dependent receptor n=1 Tax=Prevotella sp. TaxID=59823 RepID=UPI002A339682|nr:carboxypeptidase-like regulatory domain-containing protein [Prevotella sp.]MDD7318708.1 TonB-dependent receptor [Prevotellaceae bacterium]MDY4019335.1 TonB-dependent receptor [Prevotella sp.]
MKRILLLHLYLIIASVSFAQVTLCGKVSDKETETDIPFANVVLYQMSDTTKMFAGTMTDQQGQYNLENLPVGQYKITVSNVGYEVHQQHLRIAMPSAGNVLVKNIELVNSNIELGEVVVKSNLTRQKTDHNVILFNKEQRANASYAKDLLRNIPNMREDPMSGKLSTMQGGGLLVLVNGMKATDALLKMIPPEKVLRVEYYDIPPARYAYVGTVINVITKTLDNGYSFGTQTLTAFTTGFNNSSAYYSATLGKHRFDLEYYLNYRDYKDRQENAQYDYTLNGIEHQDYTQGKDAFGYTTHSLSLKYALVDAEKQIFQATFTPDYSKFFSKAVYEGIYKKDNYVNSLFKDWDKNDKTIHPALDLYYWRKISDKDELTLNINLNHFQTKGDDKRKEIEKYTESKMYEDLMTLKNRKQSVIGEAAYSRTLSLTSKLNAGYKIEYSHLLSDIDNLFGSSKYNSDYLKQYAYGEITGTKAKWMYRLSLGFTHIYSNCLENKYNRLLFTPKMVVGYSFSDNNSLRFVINSSPVMPGIDMLSNNAISITRDIVKKGNPNLTNGSMTQVMMMDSYNNKWINLLLGGFYQYEHNPINEYFRVEGDKLILTYRNTSRNQYYGTFLQSQIKPLGNELLQIGLFVQPLWQKVTTPEGVHTNFSLENRFSMSLIYKNFILNYQYVIPYYSVSGLFRSLSENNNDLSITYKLKNWQFNMGLLFIGKDAHYRTETTGESAVRYFDDRIIRDNKSMFIIGFSYNFQSGKQKEVSRKLNNRDNIAPTF